MKKKWITNILLIIFVLIFAGSGYYLYQYFHAAKETQNELDELIALKNESEEESENDMEPVKTETGKTVIKKYKKLYKKNKDFIGWIQVKGTEINYPVMQTKNDSEYYLHKNFNKQDDVNGLPFLDAKCDVEEVNSNLAIYGHHMKSGMMFAHLMDYQNKSFYEKHKKVLVDTLYEEREYEVVAAFYSQIYKEDVTDVFKYYSYAGKLSEKQYNTYVKNCKKLSQYDTGVTPKYGEQLLTLVTCAYHTENGRFVVLARRVK